MVDYSRKTVWGRFKSPLGTRTAANRQRLGSCAGRMPSLPPAKHVYCILYNHMLWRTGSIPSPLYTKLLAFTFKLCEHKFPGAYMYFCCTSLISLGMVITRKLWNKTTFKLYLSVFDVFTKQIVYSSSLKINLLNEMGLFALHNCCVSSSLEYLNII